MKTILVVEDERPISSVLKAYLSKAGFAVEQAFDGERALALFDALKPALVLLDVKLPDIDGRTILQRIRAKSSCPVIMLSALGDVHNRLEGLNAGADDYLAKPFVGDEVVARVQAVLRRLPQVQSEDQALFGRLRIDYLAREVFLGDQRLILTPRDLALLLFFSRHVNRSFSREQLLDAVWGVDYTGSDRAVDLAVKRLREALAGWPEDEGEIVTLRGLGYQFRVKASP